jgi:predicted nucleic acid-binding protein
MNLEDAFSGVDRCFLDTAPIIYYVEQNSAYFAIARSVFQRLKAGDFTAVTSPVTLAECLVVPHRQGLTQLKQDFVDVITAGENTLFSPITAEIGKQAAELRVQYNLKLPDALQIATAKAVGCQAFLTNDIALKRIGELQILILSELTS